jgi:hypothetical protein
LASRMVTDFMKAMSPHVATFVQQTDSAAGGRSAPPYPRRRCLRAKAPLVWAPIGYVPYGRAMKTTIEISDPLLRDARRIAEREGVTLRTIVERGLRRVVAETRTGAPFKLRRASFKGRGLQAGLSDASWDKLRDLAYEGRGA